MATLSNRSIETSGCPNAGYIPPQEAIETIVFYAGRLVNAEGIDDLDAQAIAYVIEHAGDDIRVDWDRDIDEMQVEINELNEEKSALIAENERLEIDAETLKDRIAELEAKLAPKRRSRKKAAA